MAEPERVIDEDERLATELIAAVRKLAASIDTVPVEVLKLVHEEIGDYFLELIDQSPPGDLSNANVERMVGSIWAEFEEAIDSRTVREAAKRGNSSGS